MTKRDQVENPENLAATLLHSPSMERERERERERAFEPTPHYSILLSDDKTQEAPRSAEGQRQYLSTTHA